MPRRHYSSVAVATTLAAPINNAVTSLTVTAASGFPVSTPWTAIIDGDTALEEIVTVTNVAGTTLTVSRGVDGTSAKAHDAGATFRHGFSGRDFDETNAHAFDTTTDVHSQYVLKSLVDAKGDLIVATADDTPDRLAVGANGLALVADSGAGAGVKWGTLVSTAVPAVSINAQTDSYTLVLADAGKLVEMGKATAQTLTVPTNASVAFPVGTKIDVLQTGAGQVTVAGASGVTVDGAPGLKVSRQWGAATLVKRGTDSWVVVGSLSA
jgi:hypothetical protein